MGNSGSVPNDNKGDNKISWDKLLKAYEELIKIQKDDLDDTKDTKKGVQKSYKKITINVSLLISITVIYVSVMLGVALARNFMTKVYTISRIIGLIFFVILLLFLVYLYFDTKPDNSKKKKKRKKNKKTKEEIKEEIKNYKQDCWVVALNSLVENSEDSYAALIEILAFTDIKSVYAMQIKLIQMAIMVGGVCFLPSLSDCVPADMNIPSIVDTVFGIIFVFAANWLSNFASSKFDELSSMNYKYSEMKRLLLEFYKENGSFE